MGLWNQIRQSSVYAGSLALLLGAPAMAQLTATEVVTLPTTAAWGGTDTQGSQLIGRTYNGSSGPGIWIVADGGYRLYLNGELLAQDNQAGRVTFVPLTFLPGTNAVSVVGVDGNGAPGVLVQIDELEKSYVSDATWKVSTSVSDNTWKNKTYSDAAWTTATASGSASTTPSGAALSGFASGSTAKWIWASAKTNTQAVLRYTFTIKAEGFGASTTGGDGGTVVVLSDSASIIKALQDATTKTILIPEGTYDFRKFQNAATTAAASGWTWCTRKCGASDANPNNTYYRINFAANTCGSDETIVKTSDNLQSWGNWITTKPNKSLIGMGRGANLRGASIYMRDGEGAYNQIYRNLAIYDVNPHLIEAGDGLSIVGGSTNRTHKYWADHISYKWISDGMDFEYTYETTVSWLDYDGRNDKNCYQTDPYVSLNEDVDVTYANNYYHGTMGRVPKVGSAVTPSRVHMYNNYIDTNTYYMIGVDGGSTTANTQMLFENNYVNHIFYGFVFQSANGYVNWTGNTIANSTAKYYLNDVAGTPVPTNSVFTPPYSYVKRTVSTLPTVIPQYAGVGAQWGAMPTYNQAYGQSNKAPTVTAPTVTGTLKSPATLTIATTATDADGTISKVDFYIGNTLVGSDNSSPYSISVAAVQTGTFSVIAKATDNSGLVGTSNFTNVTVATGDAAPVITSVDTFTVAENTTAVGTITATDAEKETITYGLAASSDSALFLINSTTGALSFASAPDFENPLDNGANNICHLVVTASDGVSTTTQNVIVNITNVDEAATWKLTPAAQGAFHGSVWEVFDMQGRSIWKGNERPTNLGKGLWLVVEQNAQMKKVSTVVYNKL